MMRDKEKVLVLPNVFTKEECENLMARFKEKESEYRPGGIYRRFEGDEYRKVVDEGVRKVKEYPIPNTEFDDLRSRLRELGKKVNDEHYQFNVCDQPYDRMIFVHYEDGSFFDHHRDAMTDSEFGYKKLAMVLQLSCVGDFRGGLLSIQGHGPQPMQQGTVVVFPVYLTHSVGVVNGSRKVVVNWLTSSTPFR
jgi:predicted 2-oxoglutarate/Fe(II)-dependent dioxygenase YbiX